ncbi:hypothetical protein FPV67DRAFT_1449553 [Lyophyllum atratum]|nr:hypothetical protein FPV67DRAFT_1449553 [Lyophyllum atratum]
MPSPHSREISALSVLHVALFVRSIDHLTCNFQATGYANNLSAEQVATAFRPLLALIRKLSAIRELTMNFHDAFFREGVPWEVFDLVRAPLATKSCTRVVITDSPGDTRIYIPQPVISNIRSPPGLTGTLTTKLFPTGLLNSSTHSKTISPGDATSPNLPLSLSSFVVKNRTDLRSNDMIQTSAALSTARSLSLACPGKSGEVWSDTLPHISSAAWNLTTLIIDVADIFPKDLLLFVSKLPKLTSLTITVMTEHYTHTIPSRTSLNFPTLIDLRAPPAYARVLLMGMRELSHLESLHVSIPDRDQLFSIAFKKTLSVIISSLGRRINHMVFAIVVNFMDNIHRDSTGIMDNLDVFTLSRLGRQASFDDVQKITLLGLLPLGARNAPGHFFLLLAVWLRKFRGLRHLEFVEQDVADGAIQPMYPLFRAIYTQCPNIRNITILRTCHDVVSTLMEHENYLPRTHGTKFTDLPEDIFYLIFQYLSDTELYTLASLSPNIRDWVLPVYLRRRGITEPTVYSQLHLIWNESTVLTDISALTLSSVKTIQHLSCELCATRTTMPFLMFEYLHRLHRLVLKLSKIDKLTLDLRYHLDDAKGPFTEASNQTWMPVGLLRSILDAVAERRCSSLVVYGGIFSEDTMDPQTAGSKSWRRLVPRISRTTYKSLSLSSSPRKMKFAPSSLAIDSETLHRSIFSDWVMSVLKNGHVTSLSITKVCSRVGDTLFEMAGFLSNLTELYLAGARIFSRGMLSLLHKLPALTALSLRGCSFTGMEERMIDPTPSLPLLRKLSLPADCITFIMGTGMDSLPSLEDLNLEVDSRHILTSYHLRGGPSIAERLKARSSPINVSLEFPLGGASQIVQQMAEDKEWASLFTLVTKIAFIGVGCWIRALPPLRSFTALRHLSFQNIIEDGIIDALHRNMDLTPSLDLGLLANLTTTSQPPPK